MTSKNKCGILLSSNQTILYERQLQMPTYTITEAIAELKVITKRLESKEQTIFQYALRLESQRDPLQANGGSAAIVKAEMQAINQLHENIIKIRRAIQEANTSNIIDLEGTQRSIADWLVWRRDVANARINFLKRVKQGIDNARIQNVQKGHKLVNSEPEAQPGDIIVNLDEAALIQQIEQAQVQLERLDGQLSLKNATIAIEVDL